MPDDSFLKLHYTDTQNEMRWRREVEYKLLNIYLIVLTILISAQGVAYQKMQLWKERRMLVFIVIFFTLVLTIVLRWKIKAENRIIKQLGNNIVKLWEQFGLFTSEGSDPFLPDASKQYGQGNGYKITLWIFWLLWVSFSIVSFILAYFLKLA